jgi:Flp pilus assembly pilin Flp
MMWKLFCNEKGQDLIEYGLLASFISISAVVVIRLIGPLVNAMWVAIHAALV